MAKKNRKKSSLSSRGKIAKDKLVGLGSSVSSAVKKRAPQSWQPHLTKKNVIIALIVLFFVAQYIQVSRITGGITGLAMKGSSLVDEVGQLNETTNMLAEDLTEVRGFLLMPTREYGSTVDLDSGDGDSGAAGSDDLQIALFKYVGYLSDQEKLKARLEDGKAALDALYGSTEFGAYLGANALAMSKLSEEEDRYHSFITSTAGTSSGATVLYLYLEKETGALYRKTANSLDSVQAEEGFVDDVKLYLTENLSSILQTIAAIEESKAYIASSFANASIAALLEAEKLRFDPEVEANDFQLSYNILNAADEAAAQVVFDKQELAITLVDARDDGNIVLQVTDLLKALPPFIEKLDALPAVQKKIVDAQLMLKETFGDKGFQVLLSNSGIVVSTEPREDEYRYYYDISAGEGGALLGSVVIEKASGMLEVVDPNGTGTTNLLFFEEGLKKKL